MKDPIDIFLILPRSRNVDHSIFDKPKIEINRHCVFGVIVATMLGKHFAIDIIGNFAVGNLSNQGMPSSLAAGAGLKDVVFLPIRLRAESLPGSGIKWGTGNSPAAIRKIFKMQLTAIGIHRGLQLANGVKTLDHLIAR